MEESNLTPAFFDYIPKQSHALIQSIDLSEVQIIVSKPRKTKLGDFKVKKSWFSESLTITINQNLSKKLFLLTLLHEIAHYLVYKKYRAKVKAHGPEWKEQFNKLCQSALQIKDLFTLNEIQALKTHLTRTKSSFCYDIELFKIFSPSTKSDELYLEELPINTAFEYQSRRFLKLKTRRTRVLCLEEKTQKKYLISKASLVKNL